MEIAEHVPLNTLTTFKTGGPARFVVTVASAHEIPEAYAFAAARGLPVIPLGGGSNVLVPDEGLEAVVLMFADAHVSAYASESAVTLTAGAGARWDDVVAYAVANGWWGIENLTAIPGTMGGAVVQNIGAYHAALSDVLVSVDAYDSVEERMRTFTASSCALGYRTSIFKEQRDRFIITRASLALDASPRPNLVYKDLAVQFSAQQPALGEIRNAVAAIRAAKFPNLEEYGTAGSFFLNPIVDAAGAAALQKKYPAMPVFDLPEGGIKVPLGWILEHVLKLRGHSDGLVEAWRAQALVITAHPGARACDVRAFAEKIIRRVETETGMKIFSEVRIL